MNRDTYLSLFEVLLELLLHGRQFLGLHPAVGQQHATELPLSNFPIHRVMALELGGKQKECSWSQMQSILTWNVE